MSTTALQTPETLEWTFDTPAQAQEALYWLSRCGLDARHLVPVWEPGGATFITRQATPGTGPGPNEAGPSTPRPAGLLPRGIHWADSLDEIDGPCDG
ncbi:hypothetical protein [Aquabacterium sp.]|uniref:hypothetical protein n=1 Tax=Aquabacterium sp. TaxID=1872578 RepID=UPI002BBC2CC2|nr:hypothetical protein [Aquabacterium sp.]HSW05684.1 hypothetical protein [Aquabacterium sp.]